MSLIIAVLMLGIIVMVHGFGHFLLAKLSGIDVVEFSLGMRPRLISSEKGGTRYSSKMLPFGGSCMILGEDRSEADEHAFNSKSVQAKISVAAAGPISNFLLAFLPSTVLIRATEYSTTQLDGILDGYLARAAGVQARDVIRSANDKRMHSYRNINIHLFTHPQEQVEVAWSRTDPSKTEQTYDAELAPVYSQENDQYMIDVQFDPAPRQVERVGQLLLHSLYEVQYWIHYVFDTFHMIFHGLVSLNDIGDPMGIVTVIDSSVDETSSYGVSAMVLMLTQLTILLGVNLRVMNLLPVPALDGGRLVFLIIKTVKGKPTDKKKGGMVHMAGMVVPLALMVLILFDNIRRLL